MTGRIFTADHRIYDLPQLLCWTVTHTGTVPCDSYSVTFLYQPEMAPVLRMAAGFIGFENGQMVARGIVDEFTVEMDGSGITATLTGRGAAARLLDNESRPVTYEDATLEEIILRHVVPYGVAVREIADVRAGAGIPWRRAPASGRRWRGSAGPMAASRPLLRAAARWWPRRRGTRGRRLRIGEEDPVLACTWREDHYGVLTEALVIDKTRNVSYSIQKPRYDPKGRPVPPG